MMVLGGPERSTPTRSCITPAISASRSAVPYASIIVELDDAPGALMAGNLLEAEYTEAKVGRRVEVVFEKLNDDITLPQFRLAPAK